MGIWSARNVVFVDYDNDGFLDVFLTENRFSPRQIALFHNNGDGRFVDQTFLIPTDFHGQTGGAGAIFGDYDNDGDADLFLPAFPHNALLRNDRGLFARVDVGGDLTDSLYTENAIWLDYDRDGYLDLYVTSVHADGNYAPRANRLLRNNGDHTFSDLTAAAELDLVFSPERGGSTGGIAAGDFDDDGCPDLYIGVFRHANRLLFNDCLGSFQDVTTREIGDGGEAFTLAVGDVDNDLDLDIFQGAGGSQEGFRTLLLLNLGGGRFLDATESLGLAGLGTNAAGTALADFDNDGDLDLFVGVSPGESGTSSFLFLNDGTGVFVDETESSGLEALGVYVAVGDYDEDGFVDLLFAEFEPLPRTAIYRNSGNDNHWLRVEVVGRASNRDGIGSRLIAYSQDLVQMREILGGLGRQQDEPIAHFGLGPRTQVDLLEIRWPSGHVDMLSDIPADQKIRVIENHADYHVVRPTIWERPPPAALVVGSTGSLTAVIRPALFEAEAKITRITADLSGVGGSVEVDLTPGDDGTYRLNSTYEISGPNRMESISVAIQQTTSLGPSWTNLFRTVEIWPAGDLAVFTDAGADNWTTVDRPSLTNLTNHPSQDGRFPMWSPDGTKIAFGSNRGNAGFDLYVMDSDGTNQVRLTDRGGGELRPSWSPDGTRIAFQSNRNGNDEIYALDADGGNSIQLTDHLAFDGEPAWSPDGTKILFTSNRGGNWEVYVMDADGSNPINLTDNSAVEGGYPAWSPDGRHIAFISNRVGNFEIYVMASDGTNPVRLTDDPAFDASPSWSSDGTRIAFQSDRDGNDEIYVIGTDGTNLIRLTEHPALDSSPAWSPAGTRILFTTLRDGNPEVYVIDLAAVQQRDPEQTIVYRGDTALELKAGGLWSVAYVPQAPLGIVGYEILHFAFHPGDTPVSEENSFRVTLGGYAIDVLGQAHIDLEMRHWQVVELPLDPSEFQAPIDELIFSGHLTGTFYLDDIRFVAAGSQPTAVEDHVSSALPEEFGLRQNFPNPFNSSTVIRFALPLHADVELAVYNLAGQKVVNLVQGPRRAGSYSLGWDGRDHEGRELASGVYLYRLQVGGALVDARKMLLIR